MNTNDFQGRGFVSLLDDPGVYVGNVKDLKISPNTVAAFERTAEAMRKFGATAEIVSKALESLRLSTPAITLLELRGVGRAGRKPTALRRRGARGRASVVKSAQAAWAVRA